MSLTPHHTAIEKVEAFLQANQPKNGRFFTIAIDGRGGSGKSTLAKMLKPYLPGFSILNGDDYFEPINDPIVWGDFNDERFAQEVIVPLQTGNTFMYRPYNWHAEPAITEEERVVTNGFCLERCYSFTFDLDWDLKIWVETPKDVCLERGLARDALPGERKKIMAAWKVWQQQEDAYISQQHPQDIADIVIRD